MLNTLHEIPDYIKMSFVVAPSGMHFFGIQVEDWAMIMSIVVALLVVIEKSPMLINRIKLFYQWIKNLKKN